jgi:hypothetical protein
MSRNITLNNVRISYPKLFSAAQINGQGDPKYSAAFLIHESNPGLKELFRLAKEATDAKYPDGKVPQKFKKLPCYKASEDEKYAGRPEYDGIWILNTSKNAKQGSPTVVDQRLNAVIDPGKIYPGLVVNVGLSVYTYDQPLAKGVTTGLEAVQIVRDGDRLDNKPSVNELFKPIDVIDEGGDPDPLG